MQRPSFLFDWYKNPGLVMRVNRACTLSVGVGTIVDQGTICLRSDFAPLPTLITHNELHTIELALVPLEPTFIIVDPIVAESAEPIDQFRRSIRLRSEVVDALLRQIVCQIRSQCRFVLAITEVFPTVGHQLID